MSRGHSIAVDQLELLPDAALIVDAQGVIEGVNRRVEEITGFSPESLIGAPVEVLVPERCRDLHREVRRGFTAEPHRRAMDSGLVVPLRRSDDQEVAVDIGLTPMRDGRVLAVVRDATDRARAEAELRHQARLLDAVGQAVIATDLDGRVEYWNAAAESLYGWSAGEVRGRNILEVTPSEEMVEQGAAIMTQLRRGETWSGEFWVRSRSGRRFPIWVVDTPCFNEADEFCGVIGVSTDISDLWAARHQAQRRATQQRHVAELGQRLLDVRDLQATFRDVCRVVAEVLDVELVKILELLPERTGLLLREGVGWRAGLLGEAIVPASASSQAGYTLLHEQPVVVDDVVGERRFGIPDLLVEHDVRSGMSVTIPRQRERFGVLGVHSRQPRVFTDDDAAFLRSVANLVGAAVDRHEATMSLERLALHDQLTGLANRTLVLDRLGRSLTLGARGRGRTALLVMDIAEFKLINDGLGRRIGDHLLIEVASVLTGIFDGDQCLGRIGDDQFAILVEDLPVDPGAAATRALEVAHHVHEAVTGHYVLEGSEVFVTVNVGLAVSDVGDDAEVLLHQAASASAHAKSGASEAIVLYGHGVGDKSGRRLTLINELRHAFEQGEFSLVYQPEVDLRSKALVGVEALLRWEHPTRGVLAPGAFLEVADSIGLLRPLSRTILVEACGAAQRLAASTPGRPPTIAVNISANELVADGFVGDVDVALSRAELPADRLVLEITERAVIQDHDRAVTVLEELRRRGVRIALDDFGTGFSSLTHLHMLPLDALKIDKSFVARLDSRSTARSIVEATVHMATSLGLTSIAEGVETRWQRDVVTELGCDVGQGYLWSPPVPIGELAEWARSHIDHPRQFPRSGTEHGPER